MHPPIFIMCGGRGIRMGAKIVHKALLRLPDGQYLLERLLNQSSIYENPLTVVLGYRGDQILEEIKLPNQVFIEDPDHPKGLLCGIRDILQLERTCHIILGDTVWHPKVVSQFEIRP